MSAPGGVVMGVDIGGSGVKAAPVDLGRGILAAPRTRVSTPQPATPAAVVAAVAELVEGFPVEGPVGVGLPAPIVGGAPTMATHIDPSWVGTDARAALTAALGRPVWVLNDADAAGLAEMRYGAGAGVEGVVLILTLGTGIGSALFVDGHLVPNTELGHIEIRGKPGEVRAAASARERNGWSWSRWAKRLQEYLDRVDRLIWPDLIVLGGGVSSRSERFLPRLSTRAPVVPAALRNEAGIVGAALRAATLSAPPPPARRKTSARG